MHITNLQLSFKLTTSTACGVIFDIALAVPKPRRDPLFAGRHHGKAEEGGSPSREVLLCPVALSLQLQGALSLDAL